MKLTALLKPCRGGTSLNMNKPCSDSSDGLEARSEAADVGVVALMGAIGEEEAPVRAACKPVMRSFSAGSTRCEDMSMRPFSSVSFSE